MTSSLANSILATIEYGLREFASDGVSHNGSEKSSIKISFCSSQGAEQTETLCLLRVTSPSKCVKHPFVYLTE